MERIAVIGCGGSGKTTLANQLGRTLGLPVLHIDGYYWRESARHGRVESSPAEWQAAHRSLIAGRRWVIEGMKLGTLPERLAAADTVVYLDASTWSCLWGVLWRRVRARQTVRPELGTYVTGLNRAFLSWIWHFRRVQRPEILRLLAGCPCEVVVLRNRRETAGYLAALTSSTRAVAA